MSNDNFRTCWILQEICTVLYGYYKLFNQDVTKGSSLCVDNPEQQGIQNIKG